ncbi:hypothetical protein Bhyg_02975 [Pseudolycoriella hygida]|uniref:SWIM-type domain-containing protein n=1 Tax=Pseudolycoriella hygida TaxID=35572 RepID=A0A9Q0S719_9DIPT|nr:hypothetical protein Bhyg_02975 [Pseudolycoriella hygida]
MSKKKVTVKDLRKELSVLGAHVSGNKAELQNRLQSWKDNNLDRTLFEIAVVQSKDRNKFPEATTDQLEKLDKSTIEWLSPSLIYQYFAERTAIKGHDGGRKLFLCEFVKNCTFKTDDNDIFLTALCSAQLKKHVDYKVQIHLNKEKCAIMKTQCECPAGFGPSAACKHVGALIFAAEYYSVTGNVKQNKTCTSLQQQWHRPKADPGRQLQKISIDEMLKVPPVSVTPNVAVTNFFCNAFSTG